MVKTTLLTILAVLLSLSQTIAQADLSYYLPDSVEFDPKIPTPKAVLGFEVGEQHVSHDKLIEYMRAVDAASERVALEIFGYTHEFRPLILLTITSPENQKRIEDIRLQHLRLTDPTQSPALDITSMPAVFYLGCSIHGNEPSGSNAALLMAYYLAAAQGRDIQNSLANTVILLDPSFNPDGLQRFSGWVNSRKSKAISADPNDMEHNEAWPGGRTNHYWFDLNRDWLVAQQPESQARLKKFHAWKPNVLTDHHEMGTNSTFFFQPGVPSRQHPLTPQKNFQLTQKIATYHARALDAIGSLYYTQEGFDDFYHGKGSSFPDVQGGIGILFEQASSRGHAQESTNGILRFPFTIRNQFTTMLSSLTAVTDMREDLLNYQRNFFKDAIADAAKDAIKTIVLASDDRARFVEVVRIFVRQDIEIFKANDAMTVNGKRYPAESIALIPMKQRQYQLIKSMTERRTQFNDSLFYDISAWNIPLATGIEYEEFKSVPLTGERITSIEITPGKMIGKVDYAFVFETKGYFAPRAINRILQNNIRCKVSNEEFSHPNGKKFSRGAIVVPIEGQDTPEAQIRFIINDILTKDGIDIYGFETGLTGNGPSLGSNTFSSLHKPEIAMLIDNGIQAADAGEIWHLLDTRFQVPVTLMPVSLMNTTNLSRYNTILFPSGNYSTITDSGRERLKTWTQNGGVIIGFENALSWLTACGIGKFEIRKNEDQPESEKKQIPYSAIEFTKGAQETSGAIFQVEADLSNPLLYGYEKSTIPVFKGNNLCIEKSKNQFANPIVFTSQPLLSGYVSRENLQKIKGSSMAGVSVLGKGRVIGFSDDLAFRAFWLGTNKMLMNAIFYGHTINENSGR